MINTPVFPSDLWVPGPLSPQHKIMLKRHKGKRVLKAKPHKIICK